MRSTFADVLFLSLSLSLSVPLLRQDKNIPRPHRGLGIVSFTKHCYDNDRIVPWHNNGTYKGNSSRYTYTYIVCVCLYGGSFPLTLSLTVILTVVVVSIQKIINYTIS